MFYALYALLLPHSSDHCHLKPDIKAQILHQIFYILWFGNLFISLSLRQRNPSGMLPSHSIENPCDHRSKSLFLRTQGSSFNQRKETWPSCRENKITFLPAPLGLTLPSSPFYLGKAKLIELPRQERGSLVLLVSFLFLIFLPVEQNKKWVFAGIPKKIKCWSEWLIHNCSRYCYCFHEQIH